MTSQRPAGIGAAPFISAGALTVFFVIQQFGGLIAQAEPALTYPMDNLFLASLWVAAAALAVTIVRIHRLSGTTSMMRVRVVRVASIVSVVMPVPLAIGGYLNIRDLLPVSYAATFLGIGISLLISNLDARRSGLLGGVLPWLGVSAAIGYIVGGTGFGLSVVSMDAFVAGYNVLGVAEVAFVAWATWAGLHHAGYRRMATAQA